MILGKKSEDDPLGEVNVSALEINSRYPLESNPSEAMPLIEFKSSEIKLELPPTVRPFKRLFKDFLQNCQILIPLIPQG